MNRLLVLQPLPGDDQVVQSQAHQAALDDNVVGRADLAGSCRS
jgi:hypothetical protein